MSEHVDALILIGHSKRILNDVPHYKYENASQGLWYVKNGKKEWYNGEPITETDKTNLYASDVFLKLGSLTASVCMNEPISFIDNTNPFKFSTVDAIQESSPLVREPLKYPITDEPRRKGKADKSLPEIFNAALHKDPTILSELTSKWAIASEVYEKRGKVTLEAYKIEDMLQAVDEVNIQDVAPMDITDTSRSLGDILDHSEIKIHTMDFPYYYAFDECTNATEMLESALEDLRLVSEAIK